MPGVPRDGQGTGRVPGHVLTQRLIFVNTPGSPMFTNAQRQHRQMSLSAPAEVFAASDSNTLIDGNSDSSKEGQRQIRRPGKSGVERGERRQG